MMQNEIEYLPEDIETFPDGTIHEATLARDWLVQGLPCAGGHSVVFFPSGRLRLAWLSRQALIGAVTCAAGIVYLHESGALLNATLAANQTFAEIAVPAGVRVTLDENGKLIEYSRHLPTAQTIEGLHCAAEFDVWFYPSGRLSVAVLASPSVVGGRKFPRGTELFLDKDGQVVESIQLNVDWGRRYKQRVFGVYEAPYQ